MQVISIVMLIPMSTAACERGFSLMNRIKSKGRSRLANSLMNNLMTISCNKEELRSFDPQFAINEWASSAHRKPNVSLPHVVQHFIHLTLRLKVTTNLSILMLFLLILTLLTMIMMNVLIMINCF